MISTSDILKASILIVDDKNANITLLEQMLRGAGYTSIFSTMDPQEVCRLYRINRYDLILLDLQMPGMDGFQVMEGLQEIETDGYLPVLVITAQPDHKIRALKAGAKDFVSKPFDLQEVLLRVHNMLEVRLLHLETKKLYDQIVTEQKYSEKLLLFFRSGPVIVSINTVADGRIIDSNDEHGKFFGYSREELVGHRIMDINLWAHPEDRGPVMKKLLKEKRMRGVESKQKRRSGEERDVLTSFELIEIAGENEPVLISMSTDITERKRIEVMLASSENRYRRLFETAQDGILILDAESGAITDANPFIIKMLGYTEEDLKGKHLWEIGAFSDVKESKAAFNELQQNEYIRYEDLPLKTKDGKIRQVEFVSNVYLVNGKKVIQCNIRDITERKVAAEALDLAYSQLTNLYNNLPEAVFSVDVVQNKMLQASPAHKAVFGYSPEEFFKNPRLWYDLTIPEDKPIIDANYLHLLAGNVVQQQFRIIRPDGKTRWIEVIIKPNLDQNGSLVRLDGIAADITERKESEEALKKSEVKYRTLIETMPDGFYRSTSEGRFLDVNPAMVKMLGYGSKEELLQIDIPTELYFQSGDRAPDHINPDFTADTEIYRLRKKDGEGLWVEDRSHYILDESGKIQFHEGVCRDITERKQAEKHLRESEDRYRRLVEFSPSAIFVHSLGKFVYLNPAAIKLLGANDESELLGKPIVDIFHEDQRESALLRISTGIIENKSFPLINERFLRLDGTTIDVEVTSLQIEYNGIPAMQDVVRDITDQKNLQQQLLQSQKSESIGTLAGGIAHDFNNILAIILGYTNIIERSTLDAQKLSESLAAISQAVKRGAALVRQILTFARKTEISFEPFSLSELIQELVSMLQQTFPKIITFENNFPKNIPYILADRTQIHQALLNLCVNARDAMPKGGSIIINAEMMTKEQLKGQFAAADQDRYVCVSVTDTGEGMNEATRNRIFDPFFTTKPLGKGTGLGLSVVYGVIQAHRGSITVESALSQGTTFRLCFPIPNTVVKSYDSPEDKMFDVGGTETILVVEDEKLLQDMVRFLLESKGYKVIVAMDGAEAVEMYKKHKKLIALVITDMGLPVMSGMEEFKLLKKINPDIKVIFASGFFDPDVKSELLKAGGKNFLQKPYMAQEILKMVRGTLDSKIG